MPAESEQADQAPDNSTSPPQNQSQADSTKPTAVQAITTKSLALLASLGAIFPRLLAALFHPFSVIGHVLAAIASDPQQFIRNLWPIFKPLSPAVAQRRLVMNGLGLLFILVVYTIFPPYISIKRTLVVLGDSLQGRRGGQTSWAGSSIWAMEMLVTTILLFNMLEALVATRQPARPPQIPDSGLRLTPLRPASPLNRPTPTPTRPRASYSTPSRPSAPSNPLSHSTSSLSHSSSTPHRSSPLSTSTSQALNVPARPRDRSGLYFGDESEASPSKVALRQSHGQGFGTPTRAQGQGPGLSSSLGQSQGQGQGNRQGGQGMDGGFVVVEKADKEWADNVWKGVNGKRSSGIFGK